MSAAHYKLDNMTAILDYNKVQANSYIYDAIALEPLEDKWRAFGWNVISIDGHDFEEILQAYYTARRINRNGKPTIIIAHTVKGRGIEFAEFETPWHTFVHDHDVIKKAFESLAKYYGRKEAK